MDVVDFLEFYKTPLGDILSTHTRELISRFWPDFFDAKATGNTITLAYGFPLPYLAHDNAAAAVFMPAHLGVVAWPKSASRTALIDEDLFPLSDQSVDRILIVHGLEHVNHQQDFLNECRRVLTAEGKILIITPNRRGIWARLDKTPLGRGMPFTMTQLGRLLRKSSLTIIRRERALYTPPFERIAFQKMQSIFAKIGSLLFPKFSGLIATEVTKTVYCDLPTAQYSRRFHLALRKAKAPLCTHDGV